MPPQVNVHRTRGKAARIGKALVLVIVVLLSLLVLPLGGLILIGLGVYIGTQAHRAGALPAADPSESPSQASGDQPGAPVRRFLGREPSYGLSAACTVTGILVFIGGVALFSNPAPQDQSAPASSLPAAPAALPDTAPQPAASPQPVPAEPPVNPAPASASRQAQATTAAPPIKTPDKPVRPQPVVPQPVAPQPVERQPVAPQPVERQPVAPQPVERQPETPQSVAPQPVTDSGDGTPYFKNCAEARAAGAAPLRRGGPGYREDLDRDGDGTACETR